VLSLAPLRKAHCVEALGAGVVAEEPEVVDEPPVLALGRDMVLKASYCAGMKPSLLVSRGGDYRRVHTISDKVSSINRTKSFHYIFGVSFMARLCRSELRITRDVACGVSLRLAPLLSPMKLQTHPNSYAPLQRSALEHNPRFKLRMRQ
jgi:hypothetical protein